MNYKIKIAAVLMMFGAAQMFGQTKVTGKVLDFNDEPQTDAMVYLDTIKTDARINNRGYFKVDVPEGIKSINIFSPKYGLLSTDFKGEAKMNFVFLDPSQSDSDKDMVSLDYSDLTKDNATNTSGKVNMGENKDVVGYANIFDYIRGKVAGVTVGNNNNITIRGVKSVSGNSNPLYVVNGMPVSDISYIDVNQVKDIKVLKNGASMYGSRGSNGVLIITLKK